MIFLIIVCACLVGACGHPSVSSSASSTSVSSVSQSPTAAPSAPAASAPAASAPAASAPAASASAAVAAPGCGTYCQQAGNSAGNAPPGYPCPASGCLQCPPQNCVSVESSGATVTNGVITVKLSCNLSTACHGAFLICLPGGALCESGPTEGGGGGRLAGSDFVVPAGTTSNVEVAVTDLGKQVASGSGGFSATVIVDLRDYGAVVNTTGSDTGNFNLTSTDAPAFPAGATASCGGTVFVGPDTSCPFAESVAKAYSSSIGYGNGAVTAVSPVTGETYEMQCTGVSPHVCRGGTNALVEFYS